MKIQPTYPSRILVEDESGQIVPLPVRVKRLTRDEYAAFEAGMAEMNNPSSLRLLGGRLAEGPEQEKDENGFFKIGELTVRARRLIEMTPEQRNEYDAARKVDTDHARDFVIDCITKYVTVPPGALVGPDDIAIETGADLAAIYVTTPEVMKSLVDAIQMENTLGPDAKKEWRSRFDSRISSHAPATGVSGEKPASTVDAAATSASVASATAPVANATPSSGSDAATAA
jgi:hypothetical protein